MILKLGFAFLGCLMGPQCFSVDKAAGGLFGTPERIRGVEGTAMGVCLDGNALYCIADSFLYAFDVSKPLSPVLLGSLSGMDNRRQVAVQGKFAYVASRETGLRIVDVSDPRNMRLRSRFDSVEFATGLDVVGSTVFLSERINGVEVVDVSDPDNPAHVCIRKTAESQSVRYRDGYLYSGEWAAGRVTVFDARDLSNFRKIGELELGGFGDGLELDGNYLYCSTGHDIPARLRMKRGISADEACGRGRGLDIFDISDPAKPRHVSRVDFPRFKPRNSDFWTPRVSGGYAFCCDSHNGLFAVDVKTPESPKLIDRLCIPMSNPKFPSAAISSVAIGNGCLYVATVGEGLWVVPVSGVKSPARPKGAAPANPGYRERYRTDDSAFHVYRPAASGQARTACLKGDVVYAAFSDAGLHVLEILPDGGFRKIGELPGGRRVTDCCFAGDRLVTAEGVDGWAVYELDGPAGFRETARRMPQRKNASVAFWCWTVDDGRVVLSARTGPYELVRLDGFATAAPICSFSGGCQWDKYLPDRAVGGSFPVHRNRSALYWPSLDGAVGRAKSDDRRKCPSGNQCNGICVFRDGFLYTVDRGCQFVCPDGSRGPVWHPPAGESMSGIPRSDGQIVVCTTRSARRISVWDFADPAKPRLLRSHLISGRPDCAAIWNGKAIVPAGHQGLIMERFDVKK